MSISPLYLGAWISLYCGITLLRSSMAPSRRDARFGPRHTCAATGYVLLVAGIIIMVATFLHHHLPR